MRSAIKDIMDAAEAQIAEQVGRPVSLLYSVKLNGVSPGFIIQSVCRICGVTWSSLVSATKKREAVIPRQIAAWLLNKYGGFGPSEIGRHLQKQHTSVLRLIESASNMIDTDDELFMPLLTRCEAEIIKLTRENETRA